MNWRKPLAGMKLKAAMRVFVRLAGVSLRNRPPRETGNGSGLNSSNQSGPVVAVAIHSLIFSEVAAPSIAATFVALGVGSFNTQALLIRPILLSGACKPKVTLSAN